MLIYGNVTAALEKVSVITTHYANRIEKKSEHILTTQQSLNVCVCVRITIASFIFPFKLKFEGRTEFLQV